MTLDQQIADTAAQILTYGMPDMYGMDAEIADARDYAKGLASHLVRNRPSSFVNAQLLEAAVKARRRFGSMASEINNEVWDGNYEAVTALVDAIAAADKEPS